MFDNRNPPQWFKDWCKERNDARIKAENDAARKTRCIINYRLTSQPIYTGMLYASRRSDDVYAIVFGLELVSETSPDAAAGKENK